VLLGNVSFMQGNYQQCIEQAEEFLSRYPDQRRVLSLIGYAELMLGNYSRAEEYFAKTIAIDSLYGETSGLGYVYWKMGRQDEARKMFERSRKFAEKELEQGNENPEVPFGLAEIYATQGNKTEAYKWLQKAIDAGWKYYARLEIDRSFDSLRTDDKFKQIMINMKADVDRMRKHVEEMDKADRP
jgi:tetratricopeptide (TPR) repeat protein